MPKPSVLGGVKSPGGQREEDMRKIFAAALLAASVASAAVPSHAATTYLKLTGHVKHSNLVGATADDPAVAQYVTQYQDPCTPGGAHAGEDGMWFALPTGDDKTDKLPAKVTFTDKLGLGNQTFPRSTPVGDSITVGTDMDVYFFKADCTNTGYTAMARSSNPEVGAVPKDAAFILVNYYAGTDDVDFTVEIGTP